MSASSQHWRTDSADQIIAKALSCCCAAACLFTHIYHKYWQPIDRAIPFAYIHAGLRMFAGYLDIPSTSVFLALFFDKGADFFHG